MRHYRHINEKFLKEVMYKLPEEFNKKTEKSILSKALGATLYMPATRENIATEVINQKHVNLTSMVIDLEDALQDHKVEEGEEKLYQQLFQIEEGIAIGKISEDNIPLLFVRIRTPEHLKRLLKNHDKLKLLTGFVLPKFSSYVGEQYLFLLKEINEQYNYNFYAMPILEGKEIIYKENRMPELMRIKDLFDRDTYNNMILNIRMGGTDFSGLYSIRRSVDTTIYDVMVVKDCITDILNVFNRAEDNYVVSGVVWEFFSNHNRMLKPSLRETPFIHIKGEKGKRERQNILSESTDGLIKETLLDKINGIVGKTIIHPTHVSYVNALQVITEEEYLDASMIVGNQGEGVRKSVNGNRMNEMKPHLNWAKNIIEKSKVYGVLRNGYNYNVLF